MSEYMKYTTRERLEGSGYKVFTTAELSARDEAIIRATWERTLSGNTQGDIDAIIRSANDALGGG